MECFRRPRSGGLVTVGDSITIGSGDPRRGFLADDSWMSYVVSRGRVAYGFNAAIRGQRTEELLAGLPVVLTRRPAVVVVATGTNDLSPGVTCDLICEAIEQIHDAGADTVLATAPPLLPRAGHIKDLNSGVRSLANRHDLRLLDFNTVLADGDDFKPGLSDDGKHPNIVACRLMADAAEPVLVEALAHAHC